MPSRTVRGTSFAVRVSFRPHLGEEDSHEKEVEGDQRSGLVYQLHPVLRRGQLRHLRRASEVVYARRRGDWHGSPVYAYSTIGDIWAKHAALAV